MLFCNLHVKTNIKLQQINAELLFLNIKKT